MSLLDTASDALYVFIVIQAAILALVVFYTIGKMVQSGRALSIIAYFASILYLLMLWALVLASVALSNAQRAADFMKGAVTFVVQNSNTILIGGVLFFGLFWVPEVQSEFETGAKVTYDCAIYPTLEFFVNTFIEPIARLLEIALGWFNAGVDYVFYDDETGLIRTLTCIVERIRDDGLSPECEFTYKNQRRMQSDGSNTYDMFGRHVGRDVHPDTLRTRTRDADYYLRKHNLSSRIDLNPLPLFQQVFDFLLHVLDGVNTVLGNVTDQLLETAEETDSDIADVSLQIFANLVGWVQLATTSLFRAFLFGCDLFTGAITSWNGFWDRFIGYTESEISNNDAPAGVTSLNSLIIPTLEDIAILIPDEGPSKVFRGVLECTIDLIPVARDLIQGRVSIGIFVDIAEFILCFFQAIAVDPFEAVFEALRFVLQPFINLLESIGDIFEAIIGIFTCAVDQLEQLARRIRDGKPRGAFKRINALINQCFIALPEAIGRAISQFISDIQNLVSRDVSPYDPSPYAVEDECPAMLTSDDLVANLQQEISAHLHQQGIRAHTTCGAVLHDKPPIKLVTRGDKFDIVPTGMWDAASYVGCAFWAHLAIRARETEKLMRSRLPHFSRNLAHTNSSELHTLLDERATVPPLDEFMHWSTGAATLWRGQKIRANYRFHQRTGRLIESRDAYISRAGGDIRQATEQQQRDIQASFNAFHRTTDQLGAFAAARSGRTWVHAEPPQFVRSTDDLEPYHVGIHPETHRGMTLSESIIVGWQNINFWPRLRASFEYTLDVAHDAGLVHHPVTQSVLGFVRSGLSDNAAVLVGLDDNPVTGEPGALLPLTRRAMFGNDEPDPTFVGTPPLSMSDPYTKIGPKFYFVRNTRILTQTLPRMFRQWWNDDAAAQGMSADEYWERRSQAMFGLAEPMGRPSKQHRSLDDEEVFRENRKNADNNGNIALMKIFEDVTGFGLRAWYRDIFNDIDFEQSLQDAGDAIIDFTRCTEEHLDGRKIYSVFCLPRLPEGYFNFIQPLPTGTFRRFLPFPRAIESVQEPWPCDTPLIQGNVSFTRCIDDEIGFYDASYSIGYVFAAAPYLWNDIVVGTTRSPLLLVFLFSIYTGRYGKDLNTILASSVYRFLMIFGTSVPNIVLAGYVAGLGLPWAFAWGTFFTRYSPPMATFNGIDVVRKFPLGYDQEIINILRFFVGLLLPTQLNDVDRFRRTFDLLDYPARGLGSVPAEHTYCFFVMAPSLGSTVFWFIYFNYYYAFYVGAVILSAQVVYNLVLALTTWFQLVTLVTLNSQQQTTEELIEDHNERLEAQEWKNDMQNKNIQEQAKKVDKHDAFLAELRERLSRIDSGETS